MPARRAIDMGAGWTIGVFGALRWIGDLESLARALVTTGELVAEVRESAHYRGFEYLRVSMDALPGERIVIEHDLEPHALHLNADAADHAAWLLIDAVARRLRALEIAHEIFVWDNSDTSADELEVSRHP